MNSPCLMIGVATATLALSGCAAAPAKLSSPPPLTSISSNNAEAEPAVPVDSSTTSNPSTAADTSAQEVVVYGSVPQESPAPKVPCGLASLAWTLNNPADVWRILAPLQPEESIDACAQNMGNESQTPAHLKE
jgi:hypothetical protein